MRSRARSVTRRAGVLRSPEGATKHVHKVKGSHHEHEARTHRAIPIKLEATPRSGTAICPGVTPAPCDAPSIQACHGPVKQRRGNSGNSPRRSSRIEQSGSCQLWAALGHLKTCKLD